MKLFELRRSGRQADLLIPVTGEQTLVSLEQRSLEENSTFSNIGSGYGSIYCPAITRDSPVKAQQYNGQQIMHYSPTPPYAVTYGDDACTTHLEDRVLSMIALIGLQTLTPPTFHIATSDATWIGKHSTHDTALIGLLRRNGEKARKALPLVTTVLQVSARVLVSLLPSSNAPGRRSLTVMRCQSTNTSPCIGSELHRPPHPRIVRLRVNSLQRPAMRRRVYQGLHRLILATAQNPCKEAHVHVLMATDGSKYGE